MGGPSGPPVLVCQKVGPESVPGETRFERRLASATREGWGGAEHDRANSAREQAVPAKRYPAVA